jgi:hypothetical protein
MVTYDDYSTPDFFYGAETPADAATGGSRLKFGGRFSKKAKKSSTDKNKS